MKKEEAIYFTQKELLLPMRKDSVLIPSRACIARRFGHGTIDTTKLRATCWPTIDITSIVGGIVTVICTGNIFVTHGLLSGALAGMRERVGCVSLVKRAQTMA
jgi:hypothetical protein